MNEKFKNPTSDSTRKKSYQTPQTLSTEKLEAMAVLCTGTAKATSVACPAGPIGS